MLSVEHGTSTITGGVATTTGGGMATGTGSMSISYIGSNGTATGTAAPGQYTGAAAGKEAGGKAWVALVGFGVVGLVVL